MSYINEAITPEDELSEILLDMADIKGQIEIAKARQKQNFEPIDAVWLAKANAALRYKGVRHQELLRLCADRRESRKNANIEERERQSRNFERMFMTVAKEMLTQETYVSILRAATDRAEQARD